MGDILHACQQMCGALKQQLQQAQHQLNSYGMPSSMPPPVVAVEALHSTTPGPEVGVAQGAALTEAGAAASYFPRPSWVGAAHNPESLAGDGRQGHPDPTRTQAASVTDVKGTSVRALQLHGSSRCGGRSSGLLARAQAAGLFDVLALELVDGQEVQVGARSGCQGCRCSFQGSSRAAVVANCSGQVFQ